MQIRHLAKSHFDSVPLRFCVQLAGNCRPAGGGGGGEVGGGGGGESSRESENVL